MINKQAFLNQETKRSIWRVFLEYREKRNRVATFSEREALREELYQIKKQLIEKIDEIKKQTINHLERNQIKVFEAGDVIEAQKIVKNLTRNDQIILKSKSNIADEIDVKSVFADKEIIETDLGDFINQILGEEDLHPVMPAFHMTPEKIAAKIYEKFGEKVEVAPEKIVIFVRNYLRKKIPHATVGITGANAITVDGKIVILENEGNISLVSRWPDKHIIISGIEKLVPDLEAALKIVRASAVWGSGQSWPVYVSIIAGPSQTADLQNQLIIGAQGAKEIYLILVDNGRSKLLKAGLGDLLFCINCGACLNFCPVYHQLGRNYGAQYLGSKGIIFAGFSESFKKAKESNCFACTLCSACFENCPLKINLPELMKKLRNYLNQNGLETEENKKMIEKMRKFGNPFGQVEKGRTPKTLYCC